MKKKKALILFTKNPELGKVKTRLAKTIGNEKALEIYIKLLQHTKEIVIELDVDKFVFYSDNIIYDDIWEPSKFNKKVQVGADLGNRMLHAFGELFQSGYQSVCIIGSDCYELNSDIIAGAFDDLSRNDVVLGPTFDGGYYLLGMNKLVPELFENKNWSTETVYSETLVDLKKLALSLSTTVKLNDIDEEKDVPQHWI